SRLISLAWLATNSAFCRPLTEMEIFPSLGGCKTPISNRRWAPLQPLGTKASKLKLPSVQQWSGSQVCHPLPVWTRGRPAERNENNAYVGSSITGAPAMLRSGAEPGCLRTSSQSGELARVKLEPSKASL